MDTFRYTLKYNQPKRYKAFRLMFIILGAFYFLFGLFLLIFDKHHITKGTINLIEGIGFMTIGFFERYSVEKFFIQFDSENISASYKKLNIIWKDIQKVHIAPVRIIFTLSNGNTLNLPLDSLGYNDVMLVKSKFNEFAKFKSIEID